MSSEDFKSNATRIDEYRSAGISHNQPPPISTVVPS